MSQFCFHIFTIRRLPPSHSHTMGMKSRAVPLLCRVNSLTCSSGVSLCASLCAGCLCSRCAVWVDFTKDWLLISFPTTDTFFDILISSDLNFCNYVLPHSLDSFNFHSSKFPSSFLLKLRRLASTSILAALYGHRPAARPFFLHF